MAQGQVSDDVATLEKVKMEIAEPPMYKIILLNDDFTPMDFVIDLLTKIFRKNEEEAIRITMSVHEKGSEVVAVYSAEIAKMKKIQAMDFAKSEGHPLKVVVELDAPSLRSPGLKR